MTGLDQAPQNDERGLCLLAPPELRETGNGITQTGWPVTIECPGPQPGLDGLGVMPKPVVSAGEGG